VVAKILRWIVKILELIFCGHIQRFGNFWVHPKLNVKSDLFLQPEVDNWCFGRFTPTHKRKKNNVKSNLRERNKKVFGK
jgi:hypothetical protein